MLDFGIREVWSGHNVDEDANLGEFLRGLNRLNFEFALFSSCDGISSLNGPLRG